MIRVGVLMQIPSFLKVVEVFPVTPDDSPSPVLMERINTGCDLQRASEMLSHAVEYLVSERINGRRSPILANQQAIEILCQSREELAKRERRNLAQRSLDISIRNILRLSF